MIKKFILAVSLLLLVAGNALAYVDIVEDAEESRFRLTTLGANNAIANSPQILIVEGCTISTVTKYRDVYGNPNHVFDGDHVVIGQESYTEKSLTECELLGDPTATSTTGYISGIAGPVIQGAAITGGAYLLSQQSDSVNTTNNNAQGQGQGQLQGQKQKQKGGNSTGCRGNCAPNFD